MDTNAEIRSQIETHWSRQLRPRLQGLTATEYEWRPVTDMWGPGEATVPAPDPPPVTTIGWRLDHLVFLLEFSAQRFGGPTTDYATFVHPGDVEEALARLDGAYARWVTGVSRLGPSELDSPAGDAGTPWAEITTASSILHVQRELIHHGAEICLLRDLYRASDGGTRWRTAR